MQNRSLLQAFALDNEGRVRSVEEVSRGLSCDCTCPCCGGRVIARQGERNEWHFAHTSGVECPGAAETALHQAAKQVLKDSRGLMVPEQVVHHRLCLPDGRSGTGTARRPTLWFDLLAVELECSLDDIRPDVLARIGDRLLAIEIAVTHYVDGEKAQRLAERSVAALEIDVAAIRSGPWTWANIRQCVVDDIANKTWIHNFDEAVLQTESRAAAIRDAFTSPAVAAKTTRNSFRTRYRIGGRIVDLIELPFGVAIWAPYDPAINEVIKTLVYPLGGHWKPRFKNWLVPLEGKDALERQLLELSGTAPTTISNPRRTLT